MTKQLDETNQHNKGDKVKVHLGGIWHDAEVTDGPHKLSGHIEAKFKYGKKSFKTRFDPKTEVKPLAEEVESLDETHKLNDKVIMSYPSLKGVKGTIGEIRHAAYKGGPKTYTIDYQHPKHSAQHTSSIQLSSSQFKAHKEGTLGEETLDEATDEAKAVKTGHDNYSVSYRGKSIQCSKREVPHYKQMMKKWHAERVERLAPKKVAEETIDEMGYGQARQADHAFADSGPAQKASSKKFHIKTKAGDLVSTHSNAVDAVRARAKIGDHTTHSIVKEMVEEQMDEISTAQMSHQGKTTIKHIKNPGVELRMAAHDVKPGTGGYRDRIALLKAAQAQGKLKEEVEEIDELWANRTTDEPTPAQHRINMKRSASRDDSLLAKARARMKAEREKEQSKKLKEEVESLDELSMDTVKSYKEKVSKNPAPSRTTPDILHKAIRRFAGKERAEDRIHHDEMVKMRTRLGIKEETLDEASFADTMKKAINAHEQGNTKLTKYHLDNAKTARYTLPSTVITKNKVMLDKYTELSKLYEGKFIETHKGEDAHSEPKPNPRHPAYATHKKAYDAKVAERKASTFSLKNHRAAAKTKAENPIKMHHIDDAIGSSYPDVEPYDHLASHFPHLHRQNKLGELADKTVRKNTKYKSLSHYTEDMHKQFKADADYDKKMSEEVLDEVFAVGDKVKFTHNEDPEHPFSYKGVVRKLGTGKDEGKVLIRHRSVESGKYGEPVNAVVHHTQVKLHESDTSKEPFNYAEWKANKVKPRKPAGYKDAEALNNQQKKVDAERKLKEEVEEIDEGTTHYSAKNGSNTYHLAVTKDGATVTNQHGVTLHASSIYGKAKGLEAVENVHNTVVKNLRSGTKSGKDTAENALKKFSHFNWESQNSTNEETLDESDVPDRMKGKQKPYVSSDGKGNYEVLGNTGQTKATFSRASHGKDAHVSAQKHLKSKYSEYMKEEVLDEAATHKVGDTVYATSPTNKALTMTGKVTKVGASLTTVKHKDGSEAHYPHKNVAPEYSDLHKDPAKKYKQFQREHLEQTGELLTLTEVKYMVENANGGAGAIAQHGGIDGQAPVNTGKAKKMMGNKASVDAIVKIIAKGAKPN